MAPGPAMSAASPVVDYHQLVDPRAKWWKNTRLIKLNLWILLLSVVISPFFNAKALPAEL